MSIWRYVSNLEGVVVYKLNPAKALSVNKFHTKKFEMKLFSLIFVSLVTAYPYGSRDLSFQAVIERF